MSLEVLLKNIDNRQASRRCVCAAIMFNPKGRHEFSFCAYCARERAKTKHEVATAKVCSRCPEKGEQPKENFLGRKRNAQGATYSWCKACRTQYQKDYSKGYKEKARLAARERRRNAREAEQRRIDALAYAQTDMNLNPIARPRS